MISIWPFTFIAKSIVLGEGSWPRVGLIWPCYYNVLNLGKISTQPTRRI